MLNKVVIVGVGLIGGSFALGLKAAGAARRIVGLERSAQALARAKQLGIVDTVSEQPELALRGADLVLIAAPVAQTAGILRALLPWLEPHTIVTDAGSTKSDVVASVRAARGSKRSRPPKNRPPRNQEQNDPS